MARLSQKLKRRIVVAHTSEKYGKELIDAIEASDSILTGDSMPDNSLGENGNLYMNLTNVEDAFRVRVATAYDPNVDDDQLKAQWLRDHPEYEVGPGGKVQKRITVTKV